MLSRATLAPGLALTLALAGCETETSSGTVVGPLAGPRVAESVLCLEVLGGLPLGITDIYEQGEVVNLWVHWEALDPPHTAEAVWFDPFGDERESTLLDIGGVADQQVTVFTLDLTITSETGRWDVELYLDGELHRGHSFAVVDLLPGEQTALRRRLTTGATARSLGVGGHAPRQHGLPRFER